MRKLGNKLIACVSVLLLLFGLAVGLLTIRDVKGTISYVVTEKIISDLNSSLEIVDTSYPGAWREVDGVLYKGNSIMNDNSDLVDKIGDLTGYTVTIFSGDTRVATNVLMDGERAVGTQAAENVIESVLHNKQEYIGEADVVGERYQTIYRPIFDEADNPIGMFYIGAPKAFEDGIVNGFIGKFLLVIMAGLLVAIFVAVLIGRSIARPINTISLTADRVANLDIRGDVSSKCKERQDEVGQLARAFEAIINGLRNVIREVQNTSQRLVASSEELAAISEESSATSQQVASAAEDVTIHIRDQVNEIKNSTLAIGQINSNIGEISENISIIENLSRDVLNKSNEGKDNIHRVSIQMNNITDGTNEVQKSLKDINDSSNRMHNIIQVIDNIAEQTNLLALNASIEAARAGEHGKGFAVVAEEVRKLAEDSQEAVQEISALIVDNHRNIQGVNELMEKSATDVNEGTEVVATAEVSFLDISQLINRINDEIQGIANAINQVVSNSEAAVSYANNVEDLSMNVSNEINSVSASTEEQTAAVEEVASSSQGLALLAEDLENIISRFIV